ncbi:hypothetical protein HDE76_004127 [Rhodanobacter sp. ANJX3]|uniref:hypothetical protein n=1 Tax=unclassified Rhodanobacter TaxID=2621553 RepID=UPI0015CD2642|nr:MULTISPECIES: hypothetical protein [unclassified Rhodanobacter]MBB5360879.1 hypothetical protein [Rhodanobacter sp. ANJX3]NYE31010.1 hypothetical protein [Rhodanobacter sp. K2T2]
MAFVRAVFWRLGFGPLLYFYVRRLATGRLPTGWAWHFVPMALQGFYYIFAFCLPMALKLSWNHGGHTHVVLPIQATLSILSFAIYWLADAGLDPDVRVKPRASDIASYRDPEMEAAKALMR